jgi:hypothetical protein
MVRVLIGSLVGGVAMFIAGFIFWATPLQYLAYSSANDTQNAAVQLSLAQNLPHTGRYIIPNPMTQVGANGYSRGPIASVDYNSQGYAPSDMASMVGGFVQEVVVSLIIGLSLLGIAGRVTDFASRARVAIGLSAAATIMILIGDPIWMHADWRYAIYATIADLAMLSAASLVLVRWFMPRLAPTVAETLH